MVINVKMVLSLLKKFNQAPKIAFREVGEPEDQKQGGQGEGGEEDQHFAWRHSTRNFWVK